MRLCFVGLLAVCIAGCGLAGTALAGQDVPHGSSIGYPTVAAALADLKTQPGNAIGAQDGWIIIKDSKHHTAWSFTPVGHPAYPAVVKRASFQRDGAWYVDMTALCEAKKEPCDELIAQFKELIEKEREYIKQQKAKS